MTTWKRSFGEPFRAFNLILVQSQTLNFFPLSSDATTFKELNVLANLMLVHSQRQHDLIETSAELDNDTVDPAFYPDLDSINQHSCEGRLQTPVPAERVMDLLTKP